MPVDLYNSALSAPCALVRMVAKHIGVELNIKDLNFAKKEHLTPEYLKINPFHKVPTINDGGFLVYESTAVCLYLLNKYAPGSDLYPKDLQKRARVDQVLATVTSFVQPHYAQFYSGGRPTFYCVAGACVEIRLPVTTAIERHNSISTFTEIPLC
ncbi:glutathione S-transferase, putative [Ixodes scapularis]|uniref:Glutathione S-transferase, putative n=1 Tax=Ixodes scapularis TaxID=6945 RepID=B7QMX3_IXOSC|nr:glutathione S-transferase, putative [Ixodes scapularis]|eukprot:XP_002400351.1 glutathione S-transferase, putative [Ixodes scapularis]